MDELKIEVEREVARVSAVGGGSVCVCIELLLMM
jgi:hypothetical protein